MKKLLILFLSLFVTAVGYAQTEVSGDSITRPPSNIKMYGDYMFDMGLMTLSPPTLPRLNLLDVPYPKNYNEAFALDNKWTFGQEYTRGFSPLGPGYYGTSSFWGSSNYMQTATFRLNDNVRLNLQGQYDADGWKRRDPSALPWQRNDFKGAIEFKSNNFGVRFEVQRRSNPFGPYSPF